MQRGIPPLSKRPGPEDVEAWIRAVEARRAGRRPAAPAAIGPLEAPGLEPPTPEEVERMEAIDRCLHAFEGLLLSPARVALLRERIDAAIERALAQHLRSG